MIRDMELLLNSVHSDEIKEYMNEALRCYNASSYRACVVLSVIAGMQDLRNKINSVASTNPNIKRLDEEISIKEQELQTFEKYMIEQCATEQIGILSADEAKMLKIYLDIRNQCAHPGVHTCKAEEARNVFSGIIDILCSKKSLIGANQKKVFVRLLEQKYFYPYDTEDIYESMTKERVQNIHKFAVLPIYKEVVKTLIECFEIEGNDSKIHNFLIFLAYAPKYKDFNVNEGLNSLIVEDQYVDLILTILKHNIFIFSKLDTINRYSIMSKIENCSKNSMGIDVSCLIEKLLVDNTILTLDERIRILQAMSNNESIENLKLVKKIVENNLLSNPEREAYVECMKKNIESYSFQYCINNGEKYWAIEDVIVTLGDRELIGKLIDKTIKEIDVYSFYQTNDILDNILMSLSDVVWQQFSTNQMLKLIKTILIRSRDNATSAKAIFRGESEMHDVVIDKFIKILLGSNDSLVDVIEYFTGYCTLLGELICNNRPEVIHQIVLKVYDEGWKLIDLKVLKNWLRIVEQKDNDLDTIEMITKIKENQTRYLI